MGELSTGHTGDDLIMCAISTATNQTLLATAGGRTDPTIRLWNPLTLHQINQTSTSHQLGIMSLCAVPTTDDRVLIASTGFGDPTVRLWYPDSQDQPNETLNGHSRVVTALCPVPTIEDRSLLITCGADNTILTWSTRNTSC
jgi:WD40 repeat protein